MAQKMWLDEDICSLVIRTNKDESDDAIHNMLWLMVGFIFRWTAGVGHIGVLMMIKTYMSMEYAKTL